MPFELRPLTLAELLDRSFRLFKHHFWLFVGLMAVPSVLVLVLNVGMLLLPEVMNSDAAEVGPSPAAIVAALAAMAAIFGLLIVYMVSYMVTIGAMTAAVSELYLDRPATIAGAYARVRDRIGRLVLLMFLIVLRLGLLFVACLVPFAIMAFGVALSTGGEPAGAAAATGIMLLGMMGGMFIAFIYSFRYSVAVPALVLEPVTATGAIGRSVALTKQNFWRSAIIVFFATLVTWAGMAIFQMPFIAGAAMADPETSTAFWLNLAGSVSGAVGGAITGPVMIVALAVFYYDLRIRKEGLDVQLMMTRLDSVAPAGAPPASLPSIS